MTENDDGAGEGEEVSNNDRLVFSQLLGLFTTALAVTASILSFYGNWRYVAGIAVLGCLLYQVRIWLLMAIVKAWQNSQS